MAAVLLLFGFSSWSVLFVVVIVLGVYEILVTAIARGTAESNGGDGDATVELALPNQGRAGPA